jgi:NAD(P)-dependent dehydrogenase (short-subunit alcohol dehydrogenase family)
MADSEALVVGGTRGIGLAIARRLAADGAAVTVMARREPPADARLGFCEADLEQSASIGEAVRMYLGVHGPPRRLVFCQRARGAASADAWSAELQVSLSATRQIIDALAEPMAAAGGGAIAIVGSVAHQLVASEQPVGYHVAKAGLAQMVRFYAVTLGPLGIRVNGVVPGSVDKRPETASGPHADAAVVPLRRVATPADIAGVVAFLCGADAACVTGQQVAVDSGLSLVWQGSR